MTTNISQKDTPEKFFNPMVMRLDSGDVPSPDDKPIFSVSGVVKEVFMCEQDDGWRIEELKILPTIPAPDGYMFVADDAVGLVTLSSIGNKNHAVNAGWAVEWTKIPLGNTYELFQIKASVGVRDRDGYLYRYGYYATARGHYQIRAIP
jgi:hypothetical protein